MTVAGSRPYDALSLLDEPLWRVLWTYHHLMEREQRTQLSDRLMRVDAAGLTQVPDWTRKNGHLRMPGGRPNLVLGGISRDNCSFRPHPRR